MICFGILFFKSYPYNMNTLKKDIALPLGILTVLVSCLVITGWFFDITLLKTVFPGWVPMKFNTAVCFGLLGIALAVAGNSNRQGLRFAVCLPVILIASLTLLEHVLHLNLGIDELFYRAGYAAADGIHPGRPSVPASVNFLLISLVLLDKGREKFAFFSWLFIWIVFLSSLFSFLGYLFGLPYFRDAPGLSQMAVHTTVIFMGISYGAYHLHTAVYHFISFRKKMVAGFILIMTVMILVLAIYNRNDAYFESSSQWLQHTNEVLQRSEQIVADIATMESAVRGYLLTGKPQFIDSLDNWTGAGFADIQWLQDLTMDNPLQNERVRKLRQLVFDRLLQFSHAIEKRQQGKLATEDLLLIVSEGAATSEGIRKTIRLIQGEEKKLLSKRTADNRYSMANIRRTSYFFGVVMFLILAVLLVLIVRNINARIRAEQEALQLNNTLEKRVEERTEALLKAESKFHYTLDNMMEGAQIINFNWEYIYVNDALLQYSKFSREELIGHTVMKRYPGIENAPIFKVFERCMYGREAIHLENEFEFPDGSTGWFELSYQPIPDGIFILSVDITERKRAELQLKNTQQSLDQLNRELEDRIVERTQQLASANKELESFSYSVSHDLRAPLRGIDGWSLALLEDYGSQFDERAHQYLARVRSETQRMGELIDDLLKLSRVSRTELKLKEVNMSAIANSVATRLTEEYPARNFAFDIEPELSVMGDGNLLEIMLTNLFSNACKFTARVSPSRIAFGHFDLDGSRVFYVKDNGVGFDMANAKNLFGAFQRMHRQSEFPGTGVGLATVQRIVNRHNGRVWAEAAVGEGATFYFTIS